jgi:hypothetical protein
MLDARRECLAGELSGAGRFARFCVRKMRLPVRKWLPEQSSLGRASELRLEYRHRTDASPTRTRRQLAGRGFGHFWGGQRLARLCLEGPSHAFGVARDHGEIGARRLVGLGAALLPIAQGAERDATARGEFFLRRPARPPQRSGSRNAFCPSELLGREGSRVGVAPCLPLRLPIPPSAASACPGTAARYRRAALRQPCRHDAFWR